MGLMWFIVGMIFIIYILPVFKTFTEYVKYIFIKKISEKELEIKEMNCKFEKKYGSEESGNQIGFYIGEEIASNEDLDYDEDKLNKK